MRHLTPASAVSALGRGREIEQFLGGSVDGEVSSITSITISPRGDAFGVSVHEVLDVGSEDFLDVSEFPPIDEGEYVGEGRSLGTAASPADAIALAESIVAARPDRWVNQGMVGDEYADYRQSRG
jgi:hypothetical protein